jgi:hypothetical protein
MRPQQLLKPATAPSGEQPRTRPRTLMISCTLRPLCALSVSVAAGVTVWRVALKRSEAALLASRSGSLAGSTLARSSCAGASQAAAPEVASQRQSCGSPVWTSQQRGASGSS